MELLGVFIIAGVAGVAVALGDAVLRARARARDDSPIECGPDEMG